MWACCRAYVSDGIQIIGRDLIFSIHSWVRIILHAVPCILLLIFTTKLSVALYEAENRKKSWAVVDNPKKIGYRGQRFNNYGMKVFFRRGSLSGGRSLYATNRMLAVICSLFLLLEVLPFSPTTHLTTFLNLNSWDAFSDNFVISRACTRHIITTNAFFNHVIKNAIRAFFLSDVIFRYLPWFFMESNLW